MDRAGTDGDTGQIEHPVRSQVTGANREHSSISDPYPCDDIAAYLADMLQELREMAVASGFKQLGKILDLAKDEADAQRAAGQRAGF